MTDFTLNEPGTINNPWTPHIVRTARMNFHLVFMLKGRAHHERGYDEPQHAAEAMLNWERFSTKEHTIELLEGDATLLQLHYQQKLSALHVKHGPGNKGPVNES